MTQFIQDTECIGDSLIKINSNFSLLGSAVQSLSALKFDKTGGTVTGPITLPNANPTNPLHATTKQYVDAQFGIVPSTIKAWVNFNGIAPVSIRSQFNISSVTRNGAGDYTINFSTPLADANYVVSGSAYHLNGSIHTFFEVAPVLANMTNNSCRILLGYDWGTGTGTQPWIDASLVNVMFIR